MNIIQKYWRIADPLTKALTGVLTISIFTGLITLLISPTPTGIYFTTIGTLFSLTLIGNMWHDNLRRARILTYDHERAEHYFTP